jgi:two-component system LytT family response regulator
MNKISALILEDERKSLELLQLVLDKYCPEVHLVYIATNTIEAYDIIIKHNPQLLIFDIEVATEQSPENAMELLERIPKYNFKLIVVSAFEQYALKALKNKALDFLTKPINIQELQLVIKKAAESYFKNQSQQILWIKEGIFMLPIDLNEIILFEAQDRYTVVYTTNNKKHIVSKTLKEFEHINREKFIRVNKKYIINKVKITQINLFENAILMGNGKIISISKIYKNEFERIFK